jgi:pectin methylesterase-like acyl-CoA thioesterase
LDANRQVTANFDSPLPARIGQTFYQSVQSAYDSAAQTGDVIMLKEGVQAGPLIANSDKNVTLKGGYNPAYTGAGAETVIDGGMTLGLGSVVIDGVGFK